MAYLLGPGDDNEHAGQRLIAAADTLGVPDGMRLDHKTEWGRIVALGHAMDSHRQAMGVQVPGGHVWHCSLSLSAAESKQRGLNDAQWAEVARYVVKAMGFDDDSGRAPCRWVAVHHGLSTGGNDHIHIGVNLVREDGTRADIHRDWVRMSTIVHAVERRFGLQIIDGRAGGGMPGVTRAEIEQAHRVGKAEPDRIALARRVRGCAAAADGEADFVRRLHRAGVLARPRYDSPDRTRVVGYAVALPQRDSAAPERGEPEGNGSGPRWFSGGQLAPDLTLPRLRETWAGRTTAAQRREELKAWPQTTPTSPSQAAAAPSQPSAERGARYGAKAWRQAAHEVAQMRERLAAAASGDIATWAGAAREAAGVLAAWSARLEADQPGPLAAAADALARSAQTTHDQPRARQTSAVKDLRGVAMVAFAASAHGRDLAGQLMLLRQMIKMIDALQEAHLARGQAQRAMALATVSRDQLTTLQTTLTARVATQRLIAPAAPKASSKASAPTLPTLAIPPAVRPPKAPSPGRTGRPPGRGAGPGRG